MDLRLEGKIAIVTGGGQGIGAAIVEGFAKERANVVIADIGLDTAQELAKKIGRGGVKVLAVRTDVTKKSDVDNLVSITLKEFGKIDILVNNAGVARDIMFVDIEEEDWDLVNHVNARGVYLVTRAVVPHMIAARYGKIINISSRAGKEGQVGLSHYAASKFAVIGLTQSVAKELGGYNINVNAVCPGTLRTIMWEGLLDARSKRQGLPREQIHDERIEQIPLKRPQNPEDIANVVLFLSSEASRNMTGESVNVTGGQRMD
jgi:NAD(P)-dependent dehydrogenase (short-subunit alcohol dehydrogenase family)